MRSKQVEEIARSQEGKEEDKDGCKAPAWPVASAAAGGKGGGGKGGYGPVKFKEGWGYFLFPPGVRWNSYRGVKREWGYKKQGYRAGKHQMHGYSFNGWGLLLDEGGGGREQIVRLRPSGKLRVQERRRHHKWGGVVEVRTGSV
eukprot:755277-Hanusia_phi.AAC.4